MIDVPLRPFNRAALEKAFKRIGQMAVAATRSPAESTLREAIDVVARYYPAEALPPKPRFGLEEIFGSR